MKINAKDILVPTISLFIISLVATVLLALVNNITVDRIQEQAAMAEAQARTTVLAEAKSFEEKDGYFIGKDDAGNTVGYVFNCVGENKGYGGAVAVTVGIDKDGKITGIVPGDLSQETPGLGQNAAKNSFVKQFAGKSGTLTVVKNNPGESEVQAITSATITSKAVTSGVNAALEKFEEIGGAN